MVMFSACYILCFKPLKAEVIKTADFAPLENLLSKIDPKETLVLFDVDDVLYCSPWLCSTSVTGGKIIFKDGCDFI